YNLHPQPHPTLLPYTTLFRSHDLPAYLKKFLKAYPTVNVHVEYRRANQVYEDVLSNVVDLGLVAYPTRDSKLEIVPLRNEILVRSEEHTSELQSRFDLVCRLL